MKQKHHNQTKIDVRLWWKLGYDGYDRDDYHRNDELEDEGIGKSFMKKFTLFTEFSEGEIAQSEIHDKHKKGTEGHHEVVGSEFEHPQWTRHP